MINILLGLQTSKGSLKILAQQGCKIQEQYDKKISSISIQWTHGNENLRHDTTSSHTNEKKYWATNLANTYTGPVSGKLQNKTPMKEIKEDLNRWIDVL